LTLGQPADVGIVQKDDTALDRMGQAKVGPKIQLDLSPLLDCLRLVRRAILVRMTSPASSRPSVPSSSRSSRRHWLASTGLVVALVVIGTALGAWKVSSIEEASAAALAAPEPMEAITAATAEAREHVDNLTVIGSVLALRSVTLRNELAGTVRNVALVPGSIVEPGTVLVALDVSVEEAELRALEAQAELARTSLARQERLQAGDATTAAAVDAARAAYDVAVAQIARTHAVIERKTIRAPFRARVGLSDVHVGQYLNEGTVLTTLQGVDDALYVDFAVPQDVAAGLGRGRKVDVLINGHDVPTPARIHAVDARVDTTTRSAEVRARISPAPQQLAPGASVRVRVPAGSSRLAVAIPGSALRKGPDGDHVFVVDQAADGQPRVSLRTVTAGALIGDEVLILEGLTAGERVAASGAFKLRDGAAVSIAPVSVAATAGR
jgi:membrane fusion protein (multidrug efflux system)